MSTTTPTPEPSKDKRTEQSTRSPSPPDNTSIGAQSDSTETVLHALNTLTDRSGVEGSIHATPVASPTVPTVQQTRIEDSVDVPTKMDTTKTKKKKTTKKDKLTDTDGRVDQADNEQLAQALVGAPRATRSQTKARTPAPASEAEGSDPGSVAAPKAKAKPNKGKSKAVLPPPAIKEEEEPSTNAPPKPAKATKDGKSKNKGKGKSKTTVEVENDIEAEREINKVDAFFGDSLDGGDGSPRSTRNIAAGYVAAVNDNEEAHQLAQVSALSLHEQRRIQHQHDHLQNPAASSSSHTIDHNNKAPSPSKKMKVASTRSALTTALPADTRIQKHPVRQRTPEDRDNDEEEEEEEEEVEDEFAYGTIDGRQTSIYLTYPTRETGRFPEVQGVTVYNVFAGQDEKQVDEWLALYRCEPAFLVRVAGGAGMDQREQFRIAQQLLTGASNMHSSSLTIGMPIQAEGQAIRPVHILVLGMPDGLIEAWTRMGHTALFNNGEGLHIVAMPPPNTSFLGLIQGLFLDNTHQHLTIFRDTLRTAIQANTRFRHHVIVNIQGFSYNTTHDRRFEQWLADIMITTIELGLPGGGAETAFRLYCNPISRDTTVH
ncbi:hypothetical protein BT96DRAFT_1000970 [Gymnopus androsaceus JB14]|uniref:Uncharacterized protein n=1 Tax=Gymnopus androsaceus JB14 TaxID=1447944 RepID=A0A6A4H3X8_9AGAR|nr:hypothetical protein BT96DRAFT_1000970 [Gymnopus androsaceus JB14]